MKVLFVVTAFYPEQAIGSIRVTKLAKYLQEQGVSITVVSLAPPPWATTDETLHFEGLERLRWDVIDQSQMFKKVFHRARLATIGAGSANAGISSRTALANFKKSLRSTAQLTYTLMKAFDWSLLVCKHAKENLTDENFDFIFCSYPSFASPLTGMQLKRLGIGKNLILDFRDPVVVSETGGLRLKRWLQQRLLRAADLRLYVSEGVKRQIVGNAGTRFDLVASNGFDPTDMVNLKFTTKAELSTKVLRVVYTGAMYGGKRDVRPLFKALTNIFAISNYKPEQIIFEYAGSEGEIFRSQAKEFGLQDRVLDHGRLTRSGALELQQRADICLLATWNSVSEQGVLTGKVFEYFMLRKPIVAIVGGDLGGSEISQVIREIGAGHSFEQAVPASITQLEDWLSKALGEKQANGAISSNYNNSVSAFDIKEVAVRIRVKMGELLEVQTHQ